MKQIIPGIISMALIVVSSNILVQYIAFNGWLTWGAFTYPFAFLVTDLINRMYGRSQAKKVIFIGFILGILCSIIGSQISNEFGPLVTLRIAIGSGIGFLVAQRIDLSIFERLRESKWWRAPLTSSIIGSSIDTFLFFTIAFSSSLSWLEPSNDVSWANESNALFGFGPEMPYWIGLSLADYTVKLAIALLALIPFRFAIRKLNHGQNIEN
jgi:uncharacterized integral membrane protein (TIGR00697 family)